MGLTKFAAPVLLGCAIVASAGAQPTGYHVGATIVLPDSLTEVLAGGRFRASILRVAASSDDARLIAAAEQLYPSSESIIAAARSTDDRARLVASAPGVSLRQLKVQQRAAGNPSDRWWLDSFDETWIPFAVTAGAVDYYLGRLHDYAAGLSPFGFSATDGDDHGSFTYTATVKTISQPDAVKVVELRILWNYWCGMMCAIEFIQTRRIFFDAAGKAVRVEGDGQPTVVVS